MQREIQKCEASGFNYLEQSQLLANTAARAAAKRHKRVRMSCGILLLVGKSLGVKLMRIGKGLGVPRHAEEIHQEGGVRRHERRVRCAGLVGPLECAVGVAVARVGGCGRVYAHGLGNNRL